MKNLLFIAMLATSLSSFAQYSKSYAPPKGWGSAELYMPAITLISTYTCVSEIPNTTYGERTAMAGTGIATSLLFHYGFRYIREHEVFKSNFRFLKKHKILLCKR